MPLSQCINQFLSESRVLIDNRQVDPFLNDQDNKSTLNLLGWSPRNMLDELKNLQPSDLCRGPLPDHSSKYPGDVWIFKKCIDGYLLYIKLKIKM